MLYVEAGPFLVHSVSMFLCKRLEQGAMQATYVCLECVMSKALRDVHITSVTAQQTGSALLPSC